MSGAEPSGRAAAHLGALSFVDVPQRVILHLDLDAAYCQFEMKRLGVPADVPFAVQQASILLPSYGGFILKWFLNIRGGTIIFEEFQTKLRG